MHSIIRKPFVSRIHFKSFFFRGDHVTFSSHTSYLIDATRYEFLTTDGESYPESNTYLAIGASKSAQIVSGQSGEPLASLVINGLISLFKFNKHQQFNLVKKTPFHDADKPLSDKIIALSGPADPLAAWNLRKITDHVKGISIYIKL
jgi:hypothetical protein